MRNLWLNKLFLKSSPWMFFRHIAKKEGIKPEKINYAEDLFRDCKKIHIEPLHGSSRGFIIFLDNKLSLWFYQESNHFIYDGFEMGPYDDGDVTVFDRLNNSAS